MSCQYRIHCFADISTDEACYSETRFRSNASGILKDTSVIKTHFSVGPYDFLHPFPINSALYVVIMFVLVCLCRFLWKIILLTYMTYKLVAHFDLSLHTLIYPYIYFRVISEFQSLFSNSLPPLNLNRFCEYCIN